MRRARAQGHRRVRGARGGLRPGARRRVARAVSRRQRLDGRQRLDSRRRLHGRQRLDSRQRLVDRQRQAARAQPRDGRLLRRRDAGDDPDGPLRAARRPFGAGPAARPAAGAAAPCQRRQPSLGMRVRPRAVGSAVVGRCAGPADAVSAGPRALARHRAACAALYPVACGRCPAECHI